jgi:hypothetical protein
MDQKNYRQQAIITGMKHAISKSIGDESDLALIRDGKTPESVDVRDAQNILDFGAALDQWNTAALAAVGTNYSCTQAVAAPTLAANKVAIFYKVGIETVGFPVSRLTFRSGGALGNILAIFDLEVALANRLEAEGYLSEPIVIDPTMTFAAQVMARVATAVLARVQLGCIIIEPAGQVIA